MPFVRPVTDGAAVHRAATRDVPRGAHVADVRVVRSAKTPQTVGAWAVKLRLPRQNRHRATSLCERRILAMRHWPSRIQESESQKTQCGRRRRSAWGAWTVPVVVGSTGSFAVPQCMREEDAPAQAGCHRQCGTPRPVRIAAPSQSKLRRSPAARAGTGRRLVPAVRSPLALG